MRRNSPHSYSVDDLVNIARLPNTETNEEIKKDSRNFKEIEIFIQDKDIKHGKTKIHNLIVYGLYVDYAKEKALTTREFNKGFSHYFPKKKDCNNNLCYCLSMKYKDGKFDRSSEHLKKMREQHGQKKKKALKTIEQQVPGIESKT